jgi:hypothetical protein
MRKTRQCGRGKLNFMWSFPTFSLLHPSLEDEIIFKEGSVGVLGPTAHLGLPLEVLFGVGWCYRL